MVPQEDGAQKSQEASSLEETVCLRPPPKRPHWESPSGRMKRVPNTIQDCLEYAILNYIRHSMDNSKTTSVTTDPSDKQAKAKSTIASSFSLHDLMFAFAGRTDKGVHALGQVVTCRIPFVVQDSTNESMDQRKQQLCDMLQGINSRLPNDISVSRIAGPLSHNLDPRHDAVLKQYSYTIKYHRASSSGSGGGGGVHTMRNALLDSACLWLVPWPLHDSIFPSLCHALSGTHDYTRFAHRDVRDKYDNFIMTIDVKFHIVSCQPTPFGGEIVTAKFLAQSKGFRRTMVRNLVGFSIRMATTTQHDSLLKAGLGQQDNESTIRPTNEDGWQRLILPNQHLIEAAPASGLCLDFVRYDRDHESSTESMSPSMSNCNVASMDVAAASESSLPL